MNNARIRDGTSYLCDKPIPSNVGISISVLPALLEDITNEADKWGNGGKNGRIDPFTEIYDVSSFRHRFSEIGAEFVSFSSSSS